MDEALRLFSIYSHLVDAHSEALAMQELGKTSDKAAFPHYLLIMIERARDQTGRLYIEAERAHQEQS